MSAAENLLRHRAVEAFLHREARLIDEWRLEEWLALFATECAYEITPTSEDEPRRLSPDTVVFIVGDDRFMLERRILRLGDDMTHSERPRSRVLHLYGNIEIRAENESDVFVEANSLVFRARRETATLWASTNRFHLIRCGGDYRIRSKRVMLANDALIEPGMGILSFIL